MLIFNTKKKIYKNHNPSVLISTMFTTNFGCHHAFYKPIYNIKRFILQITFEVELSMNMEGFYFLNTSSHYYSQVTNVEYPEIVVY